MVINRKLLIQRNVPHLRPSDRPSYSLQPRRNKAKQQIWLTASKARADGRIYCDIPARNIEFL